MISISLVSVHRLDCFGASISYSFLLAYLKMGYTMLYHVIPPTGHFNWESMIINSTIKMTTALFFWQLIATNLGFCWRESSQSAYIGMMSWFGIIWDTYGYMSFLFRIIPIIFRTVGQFAMSKASFGWVCRSPPKTVSDKLWTACWVAADRARYSSPFVRSILFGGVYHLDALWAARLVTALLRYSLRFQGCPPWSLRFGSPCATLNTWLLRCHWVRVRPWVWQHPLGGVKLDLSVPLSPQLVDGWINHCRHVLRVGWRAYQFKEWCASSRHELLEIPSPLHWFQKINWGDARDWATTTASAATVCLGATYSPAHWQHKDPSCAGCIWPGCSSLGHFHHVFWECASRPHFAPARPASPFLARFGWSAGEDPQIVQSVRVWLSFVQSQLWKVQYG